MGLNIAIIGAGIAGLCTAKTLMALGHTVTVFEKEPDLGGVWSSSRRYPGLTTQNPRETYCFSDWPMPADYPEWPSGAQMQAYLQSYADAFAVTPQIRFGHAVIDADLLDGDKGWQLLVERPSGRKTLDYDWVIACNGIFSIPAVPQFNGIEAFQEAGGQVLHTSQFTRKDDAMGKNVLVIGYGKSSCDVANAVSPIAKSTNMVVRHLIWKIPKRIGNVLNFKHLLLNRLGEGLFPWTELNGFEAFLHGPGCFLRNGLLSATEWVIARQLHLRAVGLHPGTPLETVARSTVSLVSDGFFEKVGDGTIGFEKGTEISRLEDGKAYLANGKVLPADIIICGTGWHQRVDFLAEAVRRKVTDSEGNFRLYRSMIPVGVPRLLLNGYNSSFFCQLNAEIGAIWIAAFLDGQIPLPSDAEMNREIDKRLGWMEERTGGKHCKGTNIVPFSIHHIDELLKELDLELPLSMRITQWLRSVRASDFATVGERFMERIKLKRV